MITILVALYLVCLSVAFIAWNAFNARLVEEITLDQAARYSQTLMEFRTIYTSEVVNTAQKNGLVITHDYQERENAIPLPATLSMLLGEAIGRHRDGAKSRLYSAYPFPWRENRVENDTFAAAAWQALRKDPGRPYFRFEESEGRYWLRYATADRMRPSCVGCHNTHPESPKTDWTTNDVRGVLEVVLPHNIGRELASLNRQRTLILLAVLTALATLGLGLVIQKARRTEVELEQRVEERTHELERANRAKSDFLANVSHEIRTPMNGILGMSDLLLQGELSDDERQRQTRIVYTSARALLEVINDLLDVSKIEAGKLSIQPAPFNLPRMLQECVELFEPQADAKGLDFGAYIDDEIPRWISADRGRLRQVLINLLGNALKFTEKGSVRLEVTQETSLRGEILGRFMIHDTGIGISAEHIGDLFTPFHQVDTSSSRRHGGTGLGLAICDRLVQLMGGTMDVQSTAGRGSSFFFVIPLEPTEPPETRNEDLPTAAPSLILLVEDNPVNQMVTSRLLTDLGHEVDVAANGQKALEAIQEKAYDLVLMDCQMPILDGYEATRSIRDSGKSDLPIVALSAHAMKGDRERCLEAGMNDHLAKPVDREELAVMLNRWLDS